MENQKKSPEELEAIRNRELQEFADAAKRAEERAEAQRKIDGHKLDPSVEVSPTQQPKYGQQHGNRKYSMFKNESSADDMPRTTDTII